MQYDDFIKLTNKLQPSEKLSGVYLALWYILKDNWNMAHKTIQDLSTDTAFWIHAYLHRAKGDPGNANYWYNCASKEPATKSIELELNDIVQTVFK